jgi:hypothetical protein
MALIVPACASRPAFQSIDRQAQRLRVCAEFETKSAQGIIDIKTRCNSNHFRLTLTLRQGL